MTEDRWFKLLNIEQQNKEPQNDEVITSIFYGSNRSSLDGVNLDWFSPDCWLLTPGS
jgi:hypothetical protein